jgi:hypothetical protein
MPFAAVRWRSVSETGEANKGKLPVGQIPPFLLMAVINNISTFAVQSAVHTLKIS